MTNEPRRAMIPCLRYRNAPAVIDWLCETFGFRRQLVVPGDGDMIAHAQISFGDGMVMLGSVRPTEADPDPGVIPQTVHIVTPDPDAIYDRAHAAGATIVQPIADQDFGGRAFTCLDPEGHVWSFGSYDPWQDAG